jgi:hypothetical protein
MGREIKLDPQMRVMMPLRNPKPQSNDTVQISPSVGPIPLHARKMPISFDEAELSYRSQPRDDMSDSKELESGVERPAMGEPRLEGGV